MESRRHKRRTSLIAVVLTSVVVVALISVVGWLGWRIYSSSRSASAAAPVKTQQAPVSAVASSQPTATLEPSSDPASSTSQVAAPAQSGSTTSTASARSATAVERAAVSFPDAPSISPKTSSVSQLHPHHKYIALTLDDGYDFQPKMLELLQQYDAHCTTFLVGSWAASHKSDLRRMDEAGFEIANHSWSHPFLTKLSSSQIKSQLTRTQRVITSVTGNQAPYLRPPYGATDSDVKSAAASLGYRVVMWNRSFGDSGRGATPERLYDNVVNAHGGVQPGDVVLCHWGSKSSYEALKRILPELKARGFEFVTVSELIADSKSTKK